VKASYVIACVCLVFASACDGEGAVSLQDRFVLGQLFTALDANGDGVLTEADFIEAGRTYRLNGEEHTPSQAKAYYFNLCDTDQNGQITRNDFYDCMA